MQAQLCPFPTLPTTPRVQKAFPAAVRGFFLSLFWLQEHKGGRDLRARCHLPSAGRPPAQLPPDVLHPCVFPELGLGLPPSAHVRRSDPCCPIPAATAPARTPLPARSSPGKEGRAEGQPRSGLWPRGSAGNRRGRGGTLEAQRSGGESGRQQVEAKDARCSRSCSSCAGLASGSACARLSRSLRRGERGYSGDSPDPRGFWGGDARVDGSSLHPQLFRRIVTASAVPGGFLVGGRQRLTSS